MRCTLGIFISFLLRLHQHVMPPLFGTSSAPIRPSPPSVAPHHGNLVAAGKLRQAESRQDNSVAPKGRVQGLFNYLVNYVKVAPRRVAAHAYATLGHFSSPFRDQRLLHHSECFAYLLNPSSRFVTPFPSGIRSVGREGREHI